jgi:Domain of unknown function (DUF4419)
MNIVAVDSCAPSFLIHTGIVQDFAAQLRSDCSSAALKTTIDVDFSTTGPVERAVFDMTFMESLKSYYSYHVYTLCGIPYVDIGGTQADWELIMNSLDLLDDLGLADWKQQLQEILGHFVAAYDDKLAVDTQWWQGLYLIHAAFGSGGVTRVSGWLSQLFLYTNVGRNKPGSEIKPADFPFSLSSTPFKWHYYHEDLDMHMVSGMLGTAVDLEASCALSVELGWLVTEDVAQPAPPAADTKKLSECDDEEVYARITAKASAAHEKEQAGHARCSCSIA